MMKKLPFSILIFCMTLSLANAQQLELKDHKNMPEFGNDPTFKKTGVEQSLWLNYPIQVVQSSGYPTSYFRNYMYPDSIVQTSFTSGIGYIWKHSMGQVLDPLHHVWRNYSDLDLDPWKPYSLDSVSIPYKYLRFNDSLPDTLVIQIYDESIIRTRLNPNWLSGASYANVEYNFKARKGGEATKEIVYLLESKDTIGKRNQGEITVAVNLKNLTGPVALTATYFPGIPANEGDTIDVYSTDFEIKNKQNTFILYDYRDEGPFVIAGNYNNGLMATSDIRYNISDNGWNGRYIPGTSYASSSGTYHMNVNFLITQEITDASIAHGKTHQLKVYPSLATNSIRIDLDNQLPTKISLCDISGQVIMGKLKGNSSINISNLSAGVYYFYVESSQGVSTHKFVKE